MSPSAESYTIKAIFTLLFVALPLLFFPSQIAGFLNLLLGSASVHIEPQHLLIPALIILFGSISTIVGLWMTYRTDLGQGLRKYI